MGTFGLETKKPNLLNWSEIAEIQRTCWVNYRITLLSTSTLITLFSKNVEKFSPQKLKFFKLFFLILWKEVSNLQEFFSLSNFKISKFHTLFHKHVFETCQGTLSRNTNFLFFKNEFYLGSFDIKYNISRKVENFH